MLCNKVWGSWGNLGFYFSSLKFLLIFKPTFVAVVDLISPLDFFIQHFCLLRVFIYLSICLPVCLSIYLFSTWNVGTSEMLEISHWNILTWLTTSQATSFNYFSNKGCFNILVEWPQRLLVHCPLCQHVGETCSVPYSSGRKRHQKSKWSVYCFRKLSVFTSALVRIPQSLVHWVQHTVQYSSVYAVIKMTVMSL